MSKIVLLFVIIALAYVNAQGNNNAQAGAVAGAPGLLGGLNGLVPNFNPENLFKAASAGKPGQDVHASFMSMTSQDGKTVTTLRKNDNGVEKNLQFTN